MNHDNINENIFYIYQQFKFMQATSDVKVWLYRDTENSCLDELGYDKCNELITKKHGCLTDPLNILPKCSQSCGVCASQYGIVRIPPHNSAFKSNFQVTLTNSFSSNNIYVRDVFIIDKEQTISVTEKLNASIYIWYNIYMDLYIMQLIFLVE